MNFHYNFRKTEYKKIERNMLFTFCLPAISHTEKWWIPYCPHHTLAICFGNITNQCLAFLCSTKIFDKLAANLTSAAANKLLIKRHDFEHRWRKRPKQSSSSLEIFSRMSSCSSWTSWGWGRGIFSRSQIYEHAISIEVFGHNLESSQTWNFLVQCLQLVEVTVNM
jgi:hypothetical protein